LDDLPAAGRNIACCAAREASAATTATLLG